MSEKAPIKISLPTFFLVIAILVIIVMGIYLYIEKTNSIKKIAELENSNSDLKNTIYNLQTKIENTINSDTLNSATQTQTTSIPTNTTSSSSANNLTYNYLKGTYEGTVSYNGLTDKVYLTLCENGMYSYNDIIGTDCAGEGYYTINGNDLTLHQILRCANDPGRTISSDTITLKINDDNSITDSKLNTVLKKSSDTVREEVDICNTLKVGLDNNFLY